MANKQKMDVPAVGRKSQKNLVANPSLAISFLFVLFSWPAVFSQIHKDSSLITGWATTVSIERGYINISDTSATDQGSNRATVGNPDYAVGPADGSTVSLGDGGIAIYTLESPISDANGPDFAVFENGFKEIMPPNLWFLELALVEASSDGNHFVRFPAISNTQTQNQVATFGQLNPENLHNLAGKHTLFNGTAFDLADLKDSAQIDITRVTHIRIIDVVGSLNEKYGTRDSQGNMINDPFPTPFWSGGFDLDALALLGESLSTGGDNGMNPQNKNDEQRIRIYPNPVGAGEAFSLKIDDHQYQDFHIRIFNQAGQLIPTTTSELYRLNQPGLYYIVAQTPDIKIIKKIIVQ